MAASQWPGWDEDQLAMLKDSYREVLGVAMPPDMDPAKATEYLRKQFEVLMGDPGAEEEEEVRPLCMGGEVRRCGVCGR